MTLTVGICVQGNYGHVYKGLMEFDHQESDRKEVAIKKLTRNAAERNSTLYEDFKNELEIMKVRKYVFFISSMSDVYEIVPSKQTIYYSFFS